MNKLGIIYYIGCIWALYQSYHVSKVLRKRYSTRDLVDTTGRDTADEGYDYFIFEMIYLQIPLLIFQILAKIFLPKRFYFNIITIFTFVAVMSLGSLRIALLIALSGK